MRSMPESQGKTWDARLVEWMSKDSGTGRPPGRLSQRGRLYFAVFYVVVGVVSGAWWLYVGAAMILLISAYVWARDRRHA